MKIAIQTEPLDPWAQVAAYQEDRSALHRNFGATAVFVGTMRDFNEDVSVAAMTLEHYPGMTERQLESICSEALQRWNILDVLVIHRVGEVRPHEAIVLVAVWAAHRAPAYDANRFIMEYLKERAPFWKKEQRHDGARWVTKNTAG